MITSVFFSSAGMVPQQEQIIVWLLKTFLLEPAGRLVSCECLDEISYLTCFV